MATPILSSGSVIQLVQNVKAKKTDTVREVCSPKLSCAIFVRPYFEVYMENMKFVRQATFTGRPSSCGCCLVPYRQVLSTTQSTFLSYFRMLPLHDELDLVSASLAFERDDLSTHFMTILYSQANFLRSNCPNPSALSAYFTYANTLR